MIFGGYFLRRCILFLLCEGLLVSGLEFCNVVFDFLDALLKLRIIFRFLLADSFFNLEFSFHTFFSVMRWVSLFLHLWTRELPTSRLFPRCFNPLPHLFNLLEGFFLIARRNKARHVKLLPSQVNSLDFSFMRNKAFCMQPTPHSWCFLLDPLCNRINSSHWSIHLT